MRSEGYQRLKEKRNFLQFIQAYEQAKKQTEKIDLNKIVSRHIELNSLIKKPKCSGQKEVESEQTIKKFQQQSSFCKIDQGNDQPTHFKTQYRNLRKSPRIHQKSSERHEQNEQYLNRSSMIKKTQITQKKQQQDEHPQTLIERLQNPGNSTLRQAKIMYKNNQFYYLVNVKRKQLCEQHGGDKQQGNRENMNQSKEMQVQSSRSSDECMRCIQPGDYWFSGQQLLKYNNGNYIREYIQTFL